MGYGSVPDVIENVMAPTPKKAAPKKAAPKKKAPKKKAPKVDLASMSKKDLLAHAKKTGVKANASMNKAALIKILK